VKKFVVFVSGGVVQNVWTDVENASVDVVDFDNLEAEGKWREEREKILDEATAGLRCVF
jgi:hypothetical protein